MVTGAAVAQQSELVTKKRGEKILPQAGDIAMGVDATPFLNYLGNFLGKTADNNYANGIFNGKDNTLYFKYFLTEKSAVRLNFTFNFGTTVEKGKVVNQGEIWNNPFNPDATSLDVKTTNTSAFNINVGYEMRRGRGRLQGFYGAELGFGFGGGKSKYEYANQMNSTNINPNSWDFEDLGGGGVGATNMTIRPIESKLPRNFNAMVGAFVGVEYFFAPSISIAGELGLGWQYSVYNQGGQFYNTYQEYNAGLGYVREFSLRDSSYDTVNDEYLFPNKASFRTVTSANLSLFFHF